MEKEKSLKLNLQSLEDFQSSDEEINFNVLRSEVNFIIRALLNDQLNTSEHVDQRLHFILSTDISDLVKQYLLFLRNLMLEKISAFSKYKSELLSESAFIDFKRNQIKEYNEIRSEFQNEIHLTLNTLEDPLSLKKIDKSLALVNNPSEYYKGQFQVLKTQFQSIISLDSQLRNLSLKFNYLKNTLINEIKKDLDKCDDLKSGFNELFALFEEDKAESSVIDEKLKKFEKMLESINLHAELEDSLSKFIDDLEDINLIKNYHQGILYINEIKCSSQLRRWLNYKILPKYREQILSLRNLEVSSSRYFHSLLAGYNTTDESGIIHTENMAEIQKRKTENFNNFSDINQRLLGLKNQISNHLSLEAMRNNDSWNESLFLNTYSQVISNTETIFSKLKALTDQGLKKIHNYLNRYDYNRPKINEQIVDFLKYRLENDPGNLYRKIFFDTKRFNDHFLIERKVEHDKLLQAIDAWKKGFGNSVLIYGKTQCGKSTFINAVENNGVFDQFIFLTPGQILTIEGRKFETDFNLDKSLNEIKKNLSNNHKYCIIIDDLESWTDPNISLLKNSKALIKHIDRASANVFFMVSTNSRALYRLDTVINLREVFTWEVELSRMDLPEFLETVLHRNETTQQMLIDEHEEELSQADLIKIARKIFTANGENVGSSLAHWVGNINESNQLMQLEFQSNNLPYIVTEENLYLMDLLLLYKSIVQIHLLDLIPKGKRDIVRNQIGRLVKLKIIYRDQDGKLSLTPVATNDIYNQTSVSKYLKQELNHYLLTSVNSVPADFAKIKEEIQECLLCFPFKSERTKITIDNFQDIAQIMMKSLEMPSQVIKHLDASFENIQFEFKRNL